MPGVPTVADAAGLHWFDIATWQGLVAPAGTPSAVIDKLNADVGRVLNLPDVVARLEAVGLVADTTTTPAEFASFIRAEAARWAKAIPEAGIQPE